MKPNPAFEQFYADLEKGQLKPFYFFWGEEEFLLQKNYHFLVNHLLDESSREFNFNTFDAQNFAAETFLDSYNMYPMMSPYRVMVLRDLETISDSEFAGIAEIFKNPNPSTIVIFTSTQVDKKKKSFLTVNKHAYNLEFKKPFENQISYWIKYLCKERQIDITDSACDILHYKIGTNLRTIDKEIQKLMDYVGTKKRIEEDDVETVVTDQVRNTIFQYIDQWSERDPLKQLKIIEQLDQSGDSEFGFLSLLARHFRILHALKMNAEARRSKEDFLRETRTPPYFYDKYLKQSRAWSTTDLENQLNRIYSVSNQLKQHSELSRAHLSRLVI
ncbi:MAG: DNA polymerase III subunit delta [Bdellovibrionaceae bacterium]|nr:DNA polymerase III subunit delta [Pseudobdellovibrionaceae bacterium]